MSLDIRSFLPTREQLHFETSEDPYQVAWEVASRLPVPQAIAEVASRCQMPVAEASLLVFCELRESGPVAP